MCGVAGIVSKFKLDSRIKLEPFLDLIRHRGPDSFGSTISSDQKCALGHVRLSIVDLSNTGNQPFVRKDLNLSIIFNGEIYNYRKIRKILEKMGYHFKSNTDTEVVLLSYHAWGDDFLRRLKGMFVIAIYDLNNYCFLIARDRIGEKPIYYAEQNGTLFFCSELKGLIELTNKHSLNTNALGNFLLNGFVEGTESLVQGIKKLQPAHMLKFSTKSGELKISRYWGLPTSKLSYDQTYLKEKLELLLTNSINDQLKADVPVGILLSGGLDSSIITAIASRGGHNVQTFNVTFPGSSLDESKHARLISDFYGTRHEVIQGNDLISLDLIDQTLNIQDEPINDSSFIPTFLVMKALRGQCKVALGGDGGDELFGGYEKYIHYLKFEKINKFIPGRINAFILNRINEFTRLGFPGRNRSKYLLAKKGNEHKIYNYFDPYSIKELLGKNINDKRLIQPYCTADLDTLRRLTELDLNNYLPEDILVKVDRASMLNSIELRAPFLDFELVEFALSEVPSSFKIDKNFEKKVLLKILGKELLPDSFSFNRKQGFSFPLNNLLNNKKWINYFESHLLDDTNKLFDHRIIKKLLESQKKGSANGERLYGLLAVQKWILKHNIDVSV